MVLKKYRSQSKSILSSILTVTLLINWNFTPPSSAAFSPIKTQQLSCGAEKATLVSLVNTQMTAFRSKNFPRAYSVTSILFKRKFSLKNFSDLIQSYYPFLMSNTRVISGQCQRIEDQASIIFRIYDKKNTVSALNYKFSQSDGHWAIDGAVQITNGDLSGI
jgi:Domain of unknown function (DUF4864)